MSCTVSVDSAGRPGLWGRTLKTTCIMGQAHINIKIMTNILWYLLINPDYCQEPSQSDWNQGHGKCAGTVQYI